MSKFYITGQYLSTNKMIFENLTVDDGLLTSGSSPPSASVEVVAATQLTNAANLSDAISYIRAWAGEGGGLE